MRQADNRFPAILYAARLYAGVVAAVRVGHRYAAVLYGKGVRPPALERNSFRRIVLERKRFYHLSVLPYLENVAGIRRQENPDRKKYPD